jgi:hypothetical protein
MPANTEIVKCPVCQIDKQVGLVTHHIYRTHVHDGRFDADLIKQFTNAAEPDQRFHPEVSIGGRTFTLCPDWIKEAKGFRHESKNKRSLQNQHADCTLCYKGWMSYKDAGQAKNIVVSPPVLVLIPAKPNDLLSLQKENQELRAELERFRNWLKLAPGGLEIIPQSQLPEPPPQTQVAPPPTQQLQVLAKVHRTTVKAVKASKKEAEKGMWCTKCESCQTTAQFTTDLKACATCQKLCHFNDDLNSCYHWDCEICSKKICKECNKSNGGNKMHPLCSQECAKKYKAGRQ